MGWTKVFSDTKTELIVYSETQVYPAYLIQSRPYESGGGSELVPSGLPPRRLGASIGGTSAEVPDRPTCWRSVRK